MLVSPELLNEISLFKDLRDAELVTIAGWFSIELVLAGETLYVEGDAATSACFIIEGQLEALKALPGGGSAQVGIIEKGSMIGEMALLVGGTRSATVRALTKSKALTVSYYFFHAALDQISIPAYKILRRVIHNMTARLEEVQARILEQLDCGPYDAAFAVAAPTPEDRKEDPDQISAFDFRPFLPVVPFFENFTDSEIELVFASAKTLELPRGEFLYREGSLSDSCYILIRGAVEISVARDRRYQFSILGPGRLCGANSCIAETAYSSDARVRSAALLLSFDKTALRTLYLGETAECLKFQRMISVNQLQERKTADNLLSTLISQDHILKRARSRSL